jgi:hypothetical protein
MILTIALSTLFAYGNAQTYDRDYTANYINKKTTNDCKLFLEKKNMRIEFYNNGQPVRIDYIFPASIDYENAVEYSEDEGALIFACYEQAGKCIEREIVKHGSKILYERSNLLVECSPEEGAALAEAGKHLIQLYNDKHHFRDKPFEQN